MSTGESTYSTISAVPSFSQPGAPGWRSAAHSWRASPRTTVHSSDRRLNMVVSLSVTLEAPPGRRTLDATVAPLCKGRKVRVTVRWPQTCFVP
jgi:hypothetical protein